MSRANLNETIVKEFQTYAGFRGVHMTTTERLGSKFFKWNEFLGVTKRVGGKFQEDTDEIMANFNPDIECLLLVADKKELVFKLEVYRYEHISQND